MGLAGKYQHESNENFDAYLKSLGVDDALVEKASKLNATLEIIIDGNKVTLKGVQTQTFPLGEEYDDPMHTGEVLKSTSTIDGNKMLIKSVHPGKGKSGTRTYEATADGLTITYTSEISNIVAKRVYKRV